MSLRNIYWITLDDKDPIEKDGLGYVYGIFQREKILYIGRTENLKSRMSSHEHKDKGEVRYLLIPLDDLATAETELILYFLPPLNKMIPTDSTFYQEKDMKKHPVLRNNWLDVLRVMKKRNIQSLHGYYYQDDVINIYIEITDEKGDV